MDNILAVTSFSSGQLGRDMYGRSDLPAYKFGLARCYNFLPLLQGPAKFRMGTEFMFRTRQNKVPRFLEFTFNDEQSYILEFTDGGLRFIDDDGLVLETAQNITDISVADPGVVTINSHGLSDGDEVYVEGIVGTMDTLNGKFYTVDNATTHTFTLLDILDQDVATTGLAYTSGGQVSRVYSISTPYGEDDLDNLQIAQEADVSYVVDGYHEPRKLSRLGLTNWTLETYDRTQDPFLTALIGAVTQSSPAVITTQEAHGMTNDEVVSIRAVEGMTELNGNIYSIEVTSDTEFELYSLSGASIDSSAYSAYTTNGKVFSADDQPIAVGLYGSRLFFGGPARNPERLDGSRGPEDDGTKRYDDFTVGTSDSHAVNFFLAASNNTLERIQWFAGSAQFLGVGGITDVFKATGAEGDGRAITGTSIDVKPTGSLGSARIKPANLGPSLFYAQRGRKVLNSFEYDLYNDGYISIDQNILNPEITRGNIAQITFQQGEPNFIWAIDEDGAFLSLTYKNREEISAWAEHAIAGTDAKVLTIAAEALPDSTDRLWLGVERTINSTTMRYVERLSIDPYLPDRFDYHTGTKSTDDNKWRSLMLEEQSTLVRSDSAISANGLKNIGLTLSAVTGDDITITADDDVFASTDVDKLISLKFTTGTETGVIRIHTYTSATVVKGEILQDFSSVNIAANSWYLSFDTVSGLDHLEGEEVVILGDGGEAVAKTVSNGSITMDNDYSRVVIGLGYSGVLETLPLEIPTVSGAALARPLTINQIGVFFADTLFFKYGRDRYNLQEYNIRTTEELTLFPPILASGQIRRPAKSSHGRGLTYIIGAESPNPCQINSVSYYSAIGEEND